MEESLELKNKRYKRFLEMEIVKKKEELYLAKENKDKYLISMLSDELKSLRRRLFAFNGKRYTLRQALLKWKEFHGEVDLNKFSCNITYVRIPGWFKRYIKQNCEYYISDNRYSIKVSDEELLKLNRPEKEY
jgi:hypothetical protein